jgi:hypothetical protein
VTTHPHLVPRLSMSRSYTSSPPCASMTCSRTALLFSREKLKRQIQNELLLEDRKGSVKTRRNVSGNVIRNGNEKICPPDINGNCYIYNPSTVIPWFMSLIRSSKTAHKVKTRKTKINFPSLPDGNNDWFSRGRISYKRKSARKLKNRY